MHPLARSEIEVEVEQAIAQEAVPIDEKEVSENAKRKLNAHGAKCEEGEELAFPHRWQIHLIENKDGRMEGTIIFHQCPDGGFLLYRVNELDRQGDLWELVGQKKKGIGIINFNPLAKEYLSFIFDEKANTIKPNLADQ
jgi:hypothetical protein